MPCRASRLRSARCGGGLVHLTAPSALPWWHRGEAGKAAGMLCGRYAPSVWMQMKHTAWLGSHVVPLSASSDLTSCSASVLAVTEKTRLMMTWDFRKNKTNFTVFWNKLPSFQTDLRVSSLNMSVSFSLKKPARERMWSPAYHQKSYSSGKK